MGDHVRCTDKVQNVNLTYFPLCPTRCPGSQQSLMPPELCHTNLVMLLLDRNWIGFN